MKVGIGFLVWLVVALVVGAAGVLGRIPPPAVQGVIVGLTAVLILCYFRAQSFRDFVARQAPVNILALHLVRLIGFYFLYLESVGRLPAEFAIPAGWGDIAVALGALLLLIIAPLRKRRGVLLTWNVVGLLDILLVVGTAARLNLTRPGEMDELTRLPLSLLPTFIVPLIIASHVFLFHLVLRGRLSTVDRPPAGS